MKDNKNFIIEDFNLLYLDIKIIIGIKDKL